MGRLNFRSGEKSLRGQCLESRSSSVQVITTKTESNFHSPKQNVNKNSLVSHSNFPKYLTKIHLLTDRCCCWARARRCWSPACTSSCSSGPQSWTPAPLSPWAWSSPASWSASWSARHYSPSSIREVGWPFICYSSFNFSWVESILEKSKGFQLSRGQARTKYF